MKEVIKMPVLPVSVRDVDKDSELTATSLLDMTSINSGSGTQHDV